MAERVKVIDAPGVEDFEGEAILHAEDFTGVGSYVVKYEHDGAVEMVSVPARCVTFLDGE
ncbi:hypothetical protein [Streptomyces johnsoniae]|uniref:Uncharacterized protein n=1 Tax=Streptomyces johnsoniae TaxID=3075532 RepID=A0ABU2RZV7_9ACTN|nr:hypothetical protein [Streptomyces sp. DSM 41886]MDT0442299.1 hypothetical protein [Streptomyces sp. DSM 41886]